MVSLPRPRPSFYLLFCGLLLLDQVTKVWAERSLSPFNPLVLIPGILNFIYVRNTGIAFGLFAGHNYLLTLFAFLLITVSFALASQLDWQRSEVNCVAAALLAGALGNLIDRFHRGYVVDFIDFYIGNSHWPAFNVADSCICISVCWILLRQFGLFSSRKI